MDICTNQRSYLYMLKTHMSIQITTPHILHYLPINMFINSPRNSNQCANFINFSFIILLTNSIHSFSNTPLSLLLTSQRRARPIQVWLAVRCVTLMLEVMLWMLRELIDQRFGIFIFLTLVFLLTLLNILVVRSYLHNVSVTWSSNS